MKLQLEFIVRRRGPWLAVLWLLLALGSGMWLLQEWLSLREQGRQYIDRAAQLQRAVDERRRAAEKLQATKDPAAQRRRQEEAKILATLRYPWGRVLAEIEAADGDDVAILSLSHEQSSGVSQLTVEALDTRALVRFVDALNNDEAGADVPRERRWYLSSYQMQPQNSPPTVKGVVLNSERKSNTILP